MTPEQESVIFWGHFTVWALGILATCLFISAGLMIVREVNNIQRRKKRYANGQ